MRYGSICSGVEAATLAWSWLGWETAFLAEVEPFPCAVLMQKFGASKPLRMLDPSESETEKEKKQRTNWKKQIDKFPYGGIIPNLGDFTKITRNDYDGEIDLLVGGPPCTAFSVAGLRKGLDDPRGNLALEFAKLAHRIRPHWLVFENVPGILSQSSGEAFAEILSAFCGWKVEVPVLRRKKNGQLIRGWKNSGIITQAPGGFGLAWRTLDAQYVRVDGYPRAVPQRRRRLFLIGHIDSWQSATTILFDSKSFEWDSEPRREKRQGTASGFEVGPAGGRQSEVSATLDTKCKDGAIRNQTGMLCLAHGQGNAEICEEKAPTLNCNHEAPIICRESGLGYWKEDKTSGPLKTNGAEPSTVVCLNNRPQEFRTEEEIIYPLRATDYKQPPIVCYENHANDSRIKEVKNGVSPQINARIGTGGGNGPLVLSPAPKGAKQPELEREQSPSVARSYGIAENIINRQVKNGGNGIGVQEELQYTLNTVSPHGVAYEAIVRRMMPIECERLMGFPDNHTRIEWNGKPEEECPDSHRYKACGNSMCVNVMRWIGMRIQKIESLKRTAELKTEDNNE
jgi:DNA (cytosine-5)-methyltransferase 1